MTDTTGNCISGKIFICFCIILSFTTALFGQNLPDTLHYNHNSHILGTHWSFTAAHITDIHLGEASPNGDYGTPGWNDTIDATTNCPATEKLRNVVHWINANATTEKIDIVFLTGDISDRAEKSGFIMAKRILDSLTVPYVVTNGNHDMWPRVSGNEAPAPFGDSVFAQVFGNHFFLLSQQLPDWNDGTRMNRIYNPINGIYSQFQNFSFSKGSYRFIVNDFASRYKKPIGVGTMVDAELYNIPGGTYPWLVNAMAHAQPQIANGIVWLQHFPADNELLSATYSFSSSEYDSLIDIIEPHAASFGLCIAGHRHRNKTYNIKRSTFSPVLGVGIETDANHKYPMGFVRLIRFWDYPSAHVSKNISQGFQFYPNPFSESATLRIPTELDLKNISITIFDMHGRLKLEFTDISSYEFNINSAALRKGIYFIKIINGNLSETIKCVVL